MTVYIMRGPSGSGKSTYAHKLRAETGGVIVSRDIIRQSFGMVGKGVLTNMEMDMLRRAVREGYDVIVDNTNLDGRHAEKYATEAHILGVEFVEVQRYEEGMDWVYVERSDIPEKAVLRQCKQARKMRPLTARVELIKPVPRGGDIPAYIFDIDGTLAHIDPDNPRDVYDGSRVSEDRLDTAVSYVLEGLNTLGGYGLPVIIVSGRKEDYRDATQSWLADSQIKYCELYMRASGDDRHDAQIKYEIYRDKIAPKYKVLGVFDDRARVVAMWQSAGLKTFDVGQNRSDF